MQVRCGGCFEIFDDQYEICPYCGYYHGASPKEAFELEIGTVLENRYIIGNEVGLGGFGITYKAWDEQLETVVAIKEYYPSSMVNRVPGTQEVIRFDNKQKAFQFGLDRLIMEAQYMAQFNTHDNIVHVLSYFEANNTAYIVMEFLNGCTLGEYVQKNGLKTWEESVDIILCICDALNEIHKIGIIHRDISPDNIFMCNDGVVKLIDFGAARFANNMESNYTVILKPGFAPPEQYTKISEQGPWTDVYAVGATLYYLVTGQKPEESTNRKTNDTLLEPIEINPDLPKYLSDGIMKAMAIEPHLRFETIDEFVGVVKKEKKVVPIKTEKTRRWIKRFIGIATLVAVLVLVIGSFVSDLVNKRKQIVLQDAIIEMWFVENSFNSLGDTYAQIIKDFRDEYPNVTIQTKAFSSELEMNEAMQTETPNIVQVVNPAQSIGKNTADLKEIAVPNKNNFFEIVSSSLKKNGGNDCYFLNDYTDYFPSRTFIPIGFTVPVLYVNTSLVQFDQDKIGRLSDLDAYVQDGNVVLVEERLIQIFTDLFNMEDNATVQSGTVEDFIEGSCAFFLSDTSVYFDVRKMPSQKTGVPKVVEIQSDNLPCQWEIVWSVANQSDSQNAAAKRFLSFMLSENAQTKLFGKSNGGKALPLNAKALETFCQIFDDLSFVPSVTKHCVFDQIR